LLLKKIGEQAQNQYLRISNRPQESARSRSHHSTAAVHHRPFNAHVLPVSDPIPQSTDIVIFHYFQ